jgi:ferric-dicitrate binding protein FerR (iron transport regulator)
MSDEPTASASPSLAELAARVLRGAELAPRASGEREQAEIEGEREVHLALLARAIREERAHASRRRWTGAALAIAAVLVAAVGLRAIVATQGAAPEASVPRVASSTTYDVRVEGGGAAEIVRGASPSAERGADAVRAGDRVIGKGAGVTVVVASGTKLTLDQGADLAVVEEGRAQVFALAAGNVRADVAKLHEGERFVVRTADTEVEVRGTSFRVERVDVAPPCRPELHTRVVVSEGVVVVRHSGLEDRVKAGEQWPSPCPAPAGETGTSAAPSSSAHATHGEHASAATPGNAAPPASAGSALAAANELFARAESANKHGDAKGAVVLFDRLLAEHPSTPLAEPATVERMRALDTYDRGRAVSAARDYLAKFPRGFARAEAEAILALAP